MSCIVCFEPFDRTTHVPMIGVCGHSVCRRCLVTLKYSACPVCNAAAAFINAVQNYQMLDLKDEMEAKNREHELENTDLREALQRAENEKREAERRIADLQEVNENPGVGAEVRLRCHICTDQVEERKARVCEPCNVENGSIMVKTDGTVVLLDAERVKEHVMCASCFMEGDHDGHKSHLIAPLKRCYSAKNAYAGLRTKFEDAANSMESNVLKLKKDLELPLSRLGELWPKVPSDEKLEEIQEMCRMQATAVEQISTNHINDLKQLQDDFTVWLLRQGQGFMKVDFRGTPADVMPLAVHPLYSISDVKNLIENREGIPAHDQIITLHDRELEDGETLLSCGIGEESELRVRSRTAPVHENE